MPYDTVTSFMRSDVLGEPNVKWIHGTYLAMQVVSMTIRVYRYKLSRIPLPRSNTANETMVEDYVQSHLAGLPVFRRGKNGHRQTLSCFDKTKYALHALPSLDFALGNARHPACAHPMETMRLLCVCTSYLNVIRQGTKKKTTIP